MAAFGRVRHARQKVLTSYISVMVVSLHRITTAVATVSPSAALRSRIYSTLNFLRTGYYDWGGTLYDRFMGGLWWSGTSESTSYSRDMSTGPGNIIPQYHIERGAGLAIRCVIRER